MTAREIKNCVSAFVLAGAACAVLLSAPAAQMVSYAYDGVYLGSAQPNPALSDPSCTALPLTRIEIRDGALRAWDDAFQTVKGIVTHDGFFNADYYFPGRRGVVFEGAIDGTGRLLGGVMDGGCVWIVDLTRTS